MAPQIKVTYFDTTGRAEITRLVLAAGGVEFEDERISHADFPALKKTLPLDQLPVITVNGTTYPQSMAMARYAARLVGLYPTDAAEALKVDVALESLSEVTNFVVEIMWGTPDEAAKAEKTENIQRELIPKILGFVESSIQGKFLLGEELSIADLFLYDVVYYRIRMLLPEYEFAHYTKIAATLENVASLPRIAAYLNKSQ
ncbi:hypothetical protein Poli38472_002370 [Pythium oligandrum]|uniref:Glutathione S-transferase n=1 Tax=Pythium oligandrum TaxID=41045 RepID=A0A8K1CH25_PYTOL|nr:hypothetical protein Poli38472_002370 [Pythium oligandrum]|eukprot:TMW63429.1 hypothetical protein Poli38472_002370 [Pythium oligandrum]